MAAIAGLALKAAEIASKVSEVAMKVGEKAVESVKNGEGLQSYMKNGMTEINAQSNNFQEQFPGLSENLDKLDNLQDKIEQCSEGIFDNMEQLISEYNEIKTELTEIINPIDMESLPSSEKNIFKDALQQTQEIGKVLNMLSNGSANEINDDSEISDNESE